MATTVDKFVLRYIANRKKPKQIDKMILLIIGFQKIDCSIRVKTSVLISIRLIKNVIYKSLRKLKNNYYKCSFIYEKKQNKVADN